MHQPSNKPIYKGACPLWTLSKPFIRYGILRGPVDYAGTRCPGVQCNRFHGTPDVCVFKALIGASHFS